MIRIPASKSADCGCLTLGGRSAGIDFASSLAGCKRRGKQQNTLSAADRGKLRKVSNPFLTGLIFSGMMAAAGADPEVQEPAVRSIGRFLCMLSL